VVRLKSGRGGGHGIAGKNEALISPYRRWVVNLVGVPADRARNPLLGTHDRSCLAATAHSSLVCRIDRQSLYSGYRRNADEATVIRDRPISKQAGGQGKGVIGQRQIDERSLAFEGFCRATARKPISNIRIDKFREGCRNQTRRFDSSFVRVRALWIPLQVLQVVATTQSLFVRHEVVQGNEVHRNTEEGACDPLSSRIRELDAGDLGQDVNAYWSNSNLIGHLPLGECLCSDSIMIEGSAELFERSNDTGGILR